MLTGEEKGGKNRKYLIYFCLNRIEAKKGREQMLAADVSDVRAFMEKLFLKETFDGFQLMEAVIVTSNTFVIDGHIREEYYTREEWEELSEKQISRWSSLRPLCFQMIKGKKTPESMKLVFKMADSGAEKLLEQSGLPLMGKDIEGLFFNVHYEKQRLRLTSGVSMRLFTMDKSLEHFWEQRLESFLKQADIAFE